LRKAEVRGTFIDADPQNFSSRFFEIGKTKLVCPEFLRSARRVGKDEEGQHDLFLATEIPEPDLPPQMIGQFKIRREFSDD
jgi:hypothetical protein